MKFRKQLSLVLIFTTLMLCFLITATGVFVYKKNIKRDIFFTDTILEHFTTKSDFFSKNALTTYTKKYLQSKTINMAYHAAELVDFEKTPKNKIINNQALKNILSPPLRINNKDVGYFELLYGENQVLIAPDNLKKTASKIKSQTKFTELKILKDNALEKGEAEGYIRFYDITGNNIINKYAVIRRLKNTKYLIAGLIKTNCYYDAAKTNVYKLKKKFLQFEKKQLTEYYHSNIIHEILFFMIIIILLMIIYIIIINFLVKSITNPLSILTERVKEFDPQSPYFNVNLPINTSKEIIDLCDAFSAQEHELVTYMNNFKIELENRHIVEHELKVAKKIQSSILPKPALDFCPEDFSLCAKLIPAESVAGDFYDYFFINDDTLVILIADVSGKGIPAAFFMQRAATLIHGFSLTEKEQDPAKILEYANNVFSKNNDTCMFVSVFLGFYNIKNHNFSYSNGGHLSPFRIYNGSISAFPELKDPALGILPGIKFKTGSVNIQKYESLVFLTNGVLDTISPENEEYGKSKFKELLINKEKLSVQDICRDIINDINSFVQGQSRDDITLIIFRRNN